MKAAVNFMKKTVKLGINEPPGDRLSTYREDLGLELRLNSKEVGDNATHEFKLLHWR